MNGLFFNLFGIYLLIYNLSNVERYILYIIQGLRKMLFLNLL
jgi:hypothetical protein